MRQHKSKKYKRQVHNKNIQNRELQDRQQDRTLQEYIYQKTEISKLSTRSRPVYLMNAEQPP